MMTQVFSTAVRRVMVPVADLTIVEAGMSAALVVEPVTVRIVTG